MNAHLVFSFLAPGVFAVLAAGLFSSALAQESAVPAEQAGKTGSTESVFHAAVRRGDTVAVRRMIGQNRRLIHALDEESGRSPIFAAVDEGQEEMVRLLVREGADHNDPSQNALMTAASLLNDRTRGIHAITAGRASWTSARGYPPLFLPVMPCRRGSISADGTQEKVENGMVPSAA